MSALFVYGNHDQKGAPQDAAAKSYAKIHGLDHIGYDPPNLPAGQQKMSKPAESVDRAVRAPQSQEGEDLR